MFNHPYDLEGWGIYTIESEHGTIAVFQDRGHAAQMVRELKSRQPAETFDIKRVAYNPGLLYERRPYIARLTSDSWQIVTAHSVQPDALAMAVVHGWHMVSWNDGQPVLVVIASGLAEATVSAEVVLIKLRQAYEIAGQFAQKVDSEMERSP